MDERLKLRATSLREPQLWATAQRIKAGEDAREEHAAMVNRIKPVKPYANPVAPASSEQMADALQSTDPRKVPLLHVPRGLEEGTPVAVRLDIPAYEKKNAWIVAVHEPKPDFTAGKVIGYDSVAHITDPQFGVHDKAALNIASGNAKATIATVKGNWKPTTPEDAYAYAQQVHSDPEWRQVGMDPERHSYFYDRETQQPVVAAEEALHIGPLVYAKNPTYDAPENYKFAEGGEVEDDTLTAYHASPRQLDEFKPSTFRGSTFFSATPKGALSGASAGMNEMIMETATEGYKGPMHLHEVAINPSVIRGLHYTPKEKDWFHSLPKRVVGDDDLEGAMRAKPNPYIAWDDVYEPNKIREGLYEYVRREAPPSLTYEQARKTGRNVYGRQHSHYAPDGDEKAAAQNVLKSGMKGYLVHDEGGLSIAMADPSHAKIKRVGRFAQGGEVEDDGITAYHGSPHDYPAERLIRSPEGQEQYIVGQPGALPEVPQGATVMQDFPLGRMRMDKIGTGEGAQAFGHGLYTAEAEGTARDYRDKLALQKDPRDAINDIIYQFTKGRVAQPTYENVKSWMADNSALKPFADDERITRRVHEVINAADEDEAFHSFKELENLLPAPSKGHMYEVRINAHPDHFLDWDKPLGEQSEHVQKAFLKAQSQGDPILSELLDMSPESMMIQDMPPHAKGAAAYKTLVENLGSQENATKFLHEAGIKGIRYLDAGSRGRGDGSRNYVVFDDKLINVKRKYADGGVVKEKDDGEEARKDRAAHGRSRRKTPLIIDQYPTQYVPHVGRQVMQTGGSAIVKRALELTSQRRQRGR